MVDKPYGFLCKAPRQRTLHDRLRAGPTSRVPVKRLLFVVGVQQAVEKVEPLGVWPLRLRVVTEVPFADQGRAISLPFQQGSHCRARAFQPRVGRQPAVNNAVKAFLAGFPVVAIVAPVTNVVALLEQQTVVCPQETRYPAYRGVAESKFAAQGDVVGLLIHCPRLRQ